MAKIKCKYHPDVPARWHCPTCAVQMCASCVKPALGRGSPTCHACQGQVSSLGVGNTIPPFWERVPHFFTYPMKADALVYLAGLSLLTLLAFIPILGLVIYLVICYALLKYGYMVLTHTARGNLEPPAVLGSGLGADGNLPLKQLVVFVGMAFVVGGASSLAGPFVGLVVLLLMLFSMPASVMSMAIDGSVLKAIDPMSLGSIVARIGLPYGILYVFLLLLMGGSAFMQSVLAAALPPSLVIVATTLVSGYFTVIMFNMMGYVVYQYHEELGFAGVREFARDPVARPGPKAGTQSGPQAGPPADAFETEISILVNEGKLDEAKARLKSRLRGYASTGADRERYHKLMQITGERAESSENGQKLVVALLTQGEGERAVAIYGECLALDPEFGLADGARTHRLAELAQQYGKGKLALRMLSRFSQRFTKYPKIPEVYLLAAKLLCEDEGDDAKALKVLDGLLQRYPGHELENEIKEYREVVQRILGHTAARAGSD